MSKKSLASIYAVLVLAYMALPWLTHFLPTQDGPCHAYNSRVILDVFVPQEGASFKDAFGLSKLPMGNWMAEAVMAPLQLIVSPRIAEKLLISAYALLFLLAGRYWVRTFCPDDVWRSFLFFPFVYHHLYQMGFFNFSIGLGFTMLSIGFWWRNRNRFGASAAVWLNILLILTYFSHLMAALLAMLGIAFLALGEWKTLGWKALFRQAALLIPSGILPALFLIVLRSMPAPSDGWTVLSLFRYLFSLEILLAHHPAHAIVGVIVAVVLGIGIFGNLRGKRDKRVPMAVGALAAFYATFFLISPGYLFSGPFIKERLALIAPLMLIPWLTIPRKGHKMIVVILAVLSVGNLAYLATWSLGVDKTVRVIDRVAADIPRGARVMTLIFAPTAGSTTTKPLQYAGSYRFAELGATDWCNFESWMPFFPVTHHEEFSINDPATKAINEDRLNYDPALMGDRVDAYLTYAMPPNSPVAKNLESAGFFAVKNESKAVLYLKDVSAPQPSR